MQIEFDLPKRKLHEIIELKSAKKKTNEAKAERRKQIFNYWLRYSDKRLTVISNLFDVSNNTVSKIIQQSLYKNCNRYAATR